MPVGTDGVLNEQGTEEPYPSGSEQESYHYPFADNRPVVRCASEVGASPGTEGGQGAHG